ncbi:MAG: tRNA 2-thiouridine(34) synthase MnmA [Patescibacteria group bacterium]
MSPVGRQKLPTGQAGGVKKSVYVGMSGGVDSSVSAYLLKKAGYKVTGVFIKVWQPDFIPCTWREDRLDAMRVAAHLDIPFKTLDLEKEYKEGVIDYMIDEYKLGRTPNPDVFCNKEVKFGAFLNWAVKNGANYIATGHYARIETNNLQPITYNLLKGLDDSKDQSYFLWTLTQDRLKYLLFPVGGMKKSKVRKIAKKIGLVTAHKKDSQGLCFISNLNMKQFLKHFIAEKKGNVINESGEIIGSHNGAVFSTIGERQGFKINKKTSKEKPYYVVEKNVSKNIIKVSHVIRPPKFLYSKNLGGQATYKIDNINWITPRAVLGECEAQVRYHGELLSCRVSPKGKKTEVIFEKNILISPGQSIVFYNKKICLGGGIID